MAWTIPTGKEILARMAATLETSILRLRPDLDPMAVSRAVRSPRGTFSNLLRAMTGELREAHDHIGWWARQWMPDSADDETMILRHAAIWLDGLRDAVKAVGTVEVTGTPGAVLPAGIELTSSEAVTYVTTAAAVIGGGGTATVSAEAQNAGAAGNLAAGIRLATVAAYADITLVTVASAFSGGADAPDAAEIKATYLTRIRKPPHGGAAYDYVAWVKSVIAAQHVAVVQDWVGYGSVGVVIAMKDNGGNPRVPTPEELLVVAEYLGTEGSQTGVRPVTARVVPVAAVLRPLPISVRLRPDTAATRAAVTEAFARFVSTIGDDDDPQNASPIGAIIERSRISEAISAAAGEYGHDLIVPAASITLERTEIAVPGAITWVAA